MTLSEQQLKAFDLLDQGVNFFITGGAGCGKSFLINELATSDQLFKKLAITASTGIAAHQINGMTIYCFAGIETGDKTSDYYMKHMHADVKKRWRETDVLIIDEISMLSCKVFNLLHDVACGINQCFDELFGGIQVVACGDFYQLPPVNGDYVFKSDIWKQYMTNILYLNQCFRQNNDLEFFNALNEIRLGNVSEQSVQFLSKRHFLNDKEIDPNYTRLFFKRDEVFKYNEFKMNQIKSKPFVFRSKDEIKNPNTDIHFQIPVQVTVKVNAVVMLVKNINVEEGLCNGTVGTVSSIETNAVWVLINEKKVKIEIMKEEILDVSHSLIGSRTGLPLQLAFALTVHKAQGMTLKKTVLNFNTRAFCKSLYYVSMSRVAKSSDMHLIHNDKLMLESILKCITSDIEVQHFYK